MNFFDLIEKRHSCRKFLPIPVEPTKENLIFEAIRLAPTAGNLQAFACRVVKEQGLKNNLAICAGEQRFIAEAPLVLVFFAVPQISANKYSGRGIDLYCIQDATIACTHAMLAATELDLASCWVGAFDERGVSHFMHAEWSWRPVAILPIGYSALKNLTLTPKSDRVQVYDSDRSNWRSR